MKRIKFIVGIILISGYLPYYVFAQMGSGYIRINDSDYPITKLFLDGNISIIGWSDDGYIAFAQFWTDEDEERHCIFVIQNIITDEIETSFSNQGFTGQFTYFEPLTFNEFWTKYSTEIKNSLRKYNIISFPDMELQNFLALKENYGLEILVEDGMPEAVNDAWSSGYFLKKNIIAKNSNDKRKIITEAGRLFDGFTDTYNVEIELLGYYKYPYGDRVVIYFYNKKINRNSGRITSDSKRRLAGCHLTIGYQ
jgi:hypothetical protein